jgi:hypothetical protein
MPVEVLSPECLLLADIVAKVAAAPLWNSNLKQSNRNVHTVGNRMLAALNAGSLGIAMKSKLLLVAATLAACITVSNAVDEKALLGHIMWSAFECSALAELAENKSEQERLYLVGLNAGRTFLEAMKAGQISQQALNEAVPINVLQRLEGPSNEFVIGKIHAAATGHTRDEIVKRKRSMWGATQKQEARSDYGYRNCFLIR